MRFKSLADLKRQKPKEVTLATLPQEVSMTHYAKEKAFKISELVLEIHEESYVSLSSRFMKRVMSGMGSPLPTKRTPN
jgi:hypothetical protein